MNEKIRFTYTPEGIAGLYLRAHFGDTALADHQVELGAMMQDAFNQGILATLKEVTKQYKSYHETKCIGDGCNCFICNLDRMRRRVLNA